MIRIKHFNFVECNRFEFIFFKDYSCHRYYGTVNIITVTYLVVLLKAKYGA